MLTHIVMWRFKDEAEGRTKEENMRYIKERLLALLGVVPELKSAVVGVDLLHSEKSWDMALTARFDDLEGMKAYRAHPLHVPISEYVVKVSLDRAVIDFEED